MEQGANQHARAWATVGVAMWLVYGLFSGAGHWLGAGMAGFAIAAVIVAMEYRSAAVKIMDCTSLGYFALEIAIVLIAGNQWIQRFHLPFVWGVFAIVAWLTVVFRAPFAMQYSRDLAPREIWESRTFYRMNLHLTVAWALVFSLGAILGAISMVIGHALLLGVIIPAAGMAFGFIFNQRYPNRFIAQFQAESRLQSVAPALEVTETIGNASRP